MSATSAWRVPLLLLGVAAVWTVIGGPSAVNAQTPLRYVFDEDRPAFAEPSFDDTRWRQGAAPFSARRAGVPGWADVIWIRAPLPAPGDWRPDRPAVSLGVVQRADETYLNGVRIGGEGSIGPAGTTWHNYPPVLPRLYAFDAGLLRADGANVLAIRIARQPFSDEAGLLSAAPALVDMNDAAPAHGAHLRRLANVDGILFGFEATVLLTVIAAIVLGVRERGLLLFACIYTPYFLFRLEQRHITHFAGLDHPAIQFAATLLVSSVIVPIVELAAAVLGRPVGLFGRAIQVGAVLSLLSFPGGAGDLASSWRVQSLLIWHGLLAAMLVMVVVWAVRARIDDRPHSAPLLLGVAAMAATIVGDMIMPSADIETTYGLRRGDIGILAFMVALGYVAFARVAVWQGELARARADVLRAQERERARFARDLHDGLGQGLSAIKLKLQVLAHRPQEAQADFGRRADALARELGDAIDDARRIAHDLAPALLEELGLFGALESHASRIAKAGLRVEVKGERDMVCADRVALHLYRIFQEALANALAHGGAGRATVTLQRVGARLRMTVEDDGDGMSSHGAAPTAGLGIATMRERARLINGTLRIDSPRTGGVRIIVTASPT